MGFTDLLASADRAALQHLGSTVRYAPKVGDPVEVRGIYDAAYLKATVGQAGVSGSVPAVFLMLSDLPEDPSSGNATITVDGASFKVREVQKDGQGGVVLQLTRTD
jgi:hypothetical protein